MTPPTTTLRLALRTLTPVSVGSDKGDQLSPYADFVYSNDGSHLHYLNLGRVERAVAAAQKLDAYVQGIRSGMDNNRSNFDLRQFLTGELKQNLADLTSRIVRQDGLKPGDRRNVNPTVKNAGQPYLPGSSIKGALRTALLYDWLVNTEDGLPYLNTAAKALERLADLGRSREIKKEIERLEDSIFDETPLLGSLKSDWGPDARFLRVSDSAPLANEALAVYALRRIRLKPGTGKSAIPQVLEAIPPGQTLYFSMTIDPWMQHKSLAYLKTGDFKTIFANVSTFSQACIANELFELRDATTRDFQKEVGHLIAFYDNLQKRAADGVVFLRLGFGKTVNDNSLLLALANGLDDQNAFNRFRSHFHRVRYADDFYPITRTITSGGMPMGWVEVSQVD